MTTLSIKGEMVEIGTLEVHSDRQSGFVLKLDDGRYVTVTGLTEEETRGLAKHFCSQCEITFGSES